MIVVRRIFAVLLVLPLAVAFALALLVSRADATVAQPAFYQEQLRALDVYDRVHDEFLPRALDDFLAAQEERLPENLAAIDLPTDERSREVMLGVLREAFPPEWIQAEVEGAIDAAVPYLLGRTDTLEVRLRLGGPLRAVAAHEPGEPSRLQEAWRELGLAERVIAGLAEASAADEAAGGEQGEAGDAGLLAVLAADAAGADAWLEAQLFGALDEFVPYLLGEREHFHVEVRFDEFPELAEPFSTALNRPPEQLLAEGFVLDDREIRAELERSGSDAFDDFDRSLGIFRAEGYILTEADLLESDAAAGEPGEDGPPLEQLRRAGTVIEAARWGAIGAVMALTLAAAFLGGRTWASRLAWGGAALVVASAVSFALAGPVYDATLAPRLEGAIAAAKAEPVEGPLPQAFRDDVLERVEAVADGMAADTAETARNWMLLSLLALAGGAGWSAWRRGTAEAESAVRGLEREEERVRL